MRTLRKGEPGYAWAGHSLLVTGPPMVSPMVCRPPPMAFPPVLAIPPTAAPAPVADPPRMALVPMYRK